MSWQPNQPSSSLVVTGGGTEPTSSSQTTRISTCGDTKQDDTAKRSADVPASCAAESVDQTSEQSSQQEQQRQQLESDRNMASMAEDILDFETPSLRSKTHLVESTRQQQDREFFRRFLNPLVGGSQDSETDEQLGVDKNDTSLIVDKLPQISQRNVPWAPVYTLPLIYATSGANQHHYQNALRNDSLFGSGGGASAPMQSGPSTSSSAAFCDGLGSPSTNLGNSNSERIFYGGGNLLDSYTDNPLASDNNNGGGGGSSGQFAFQAAKLASNLYQSDYRQQIGSGRTYSSVLNNPSALGPYTSSLFDVHDRQTPITNNNRDFFSNLNDPSNLFSAQASGNHQQHNHLANRNQSRPFNQSDFFSIGDDQQQQQQNCAGSHQMINSHQYRAHTSGQPGGRSNNSNHMMTQHGDRNPPGYLASQQQRAAFDRSGFPLTGSTIPKRRHKLPPFAAASNEAGRVSKFDAHGSRMVGAGAASGSNADGERFSRKVFVGGLPPDIDEEEIKASFRSFGALVVDWPHKAESKSYFPPKGYAFLLFQEEASVQTLIDSCFQENDKLYLCVSSPTTKDKPVQIRPWRLSDTDYVLDSTLALDPRKTVFVGGVPRPLKASELANIMNNLYGGVCYAGIDTDPDLKYPKGAGRVAFSNHQSYIAAISARFVHIHHSELEKRVEVKPYVLDDQFCDECQGARCGNKFAPFFCANITCLRYYCDSCWSSVHSQGGREFHKPLVKEGGDRPRGAQSLRW